MSMTDCARTGRQMLESKVTEDMHKANTTLIELGKSHISLGFGATVSNI